MALPNGNLKALIDAKMRVWEEGKAFLDRTEARGKSMTAAERSQWDRYNERIDEIDETINDIVARENRAVAGAFTYEALEREVGPLGVRTARADQQEGLRRWARGEVAAELSIDLGPAQELERMRLRGVSPAELETERRALAWDTGSIASGVPTLMATELYQLMQANFAALALPTTKLVTDTGAQMKIPRLNAHSIGTQVSGQGTVLAGTDPTFLSNTIDAYKYGQLVRISAEALQDASFDVQSFLLSDLARSVARAASQDFTTGSGTGQPLGFTTAALVGSNGTIPTGGTLITPTYENLVDLVYSVNSNYRSSGNAAFVMRDLTAAKIRKLRDQGGGTLGATMWQPSQTVGVSGAEPGLLLGYPVYTDFGMASCASDAKIMVFGDWQAYYLRQVGPLVVERDASRYFDTDEIGFRSKWRLDSDIVDLTALNILHQSVT